MYVDKQKEKKLVRLVPEKKGLYQKNMNWYFLRENVKKVDKIYATKTKACVFSHVLYLVDVIRKSSKALKFELLAVHLSLLLMFIWVILTLQPRVIIILIY